MSPQAIKEQIETLNRVFERVSQNKEASEAFLISAGLLKPPLSKKIPRIDLDAGFTKTSIYGTKKNHLGRGHDAKVYQN